MGIFKSIFGGRSHDSGTTMKPQAPRIETPDVQFQGTGLQDLDTKARLLLNNKRYEELMSLYLRAWNKLEDDEAPLDLLRIVRRNYLLASAIRQMDMVKDFDIPLTDYTIEYGYDYAEDEGCHYAEHRIKMSYAEYFANCDKYPCENCTATYRKYFCSFLFRIKE